MKKRKLNFHQLYNTLGFKQLDILNRMANGEEMQIINYITNNEVDKRLKIGGTFTNLSIKEINTLISKGFFTMVNVSLNKDIIDIFICELTDVNKKLFVV